MLAIESTPLSVARFGSLAITWSLAAGGWRLTRVIGWGQVEDGPIRLVRRLWVDHVFVGGTLLAALPIAMQVGPQSSPFYPWAIGLSSLALGIVLISLPIRVTSPVAVGGAYIASNLLVWIVCAWKFAQGSVPAPVAVACALATLGAA